MRMISRFFVWISFVVLISIVACDPSCKMDLNYNKKYVMVACSKINGWNDLSTAQHNYLDGKSDKDVSQLFFHESKVPSVSEVFVKFQNLEFLNLVSNSLNYLDENSFANARALESFNLAYNNISSLRNGSFTGARSLKFLYLNNNIISIIDSHTFAPLYKLEYLDLSSNKLTHIHPQTFHTLTNLWSLSLANNSLTELHVSTFQQLINLQLLRLQENQLTSLDGNLLSRNTRLRALHINNCGIEAVGGNFFDNLKLLNWVQSEGNVCIDKEFYDFNNISTVVAEFKQCFNNYDNLTSQ